MCELSRCCSRDLELSCDVPIGSKSADVLSEAILLVTDTISQSSLQRMQAEQQAACKGSGDVLAEALLLVSGSISPSSLIQQLQHAEASDEVGAMPEHEIQAAEDQFSDALCTTPVRQAGTHQSADDRDDSQSLFAHGMPLPLEPIEIDQMIVNQGGLVSPPHGEQTSVQDQLAEQLQHQNQLFLAQADDQRQKAEESWAKEKQEILHAWEKDHATLTQMLLKSMSPPSVSSFVRSPEVADFLRSPSPTRVIKSLSSEFTHSPEIEMVRR